MLTISTRLTSFESESHYNLEKNTSNTPFLPFKQEHIHSPDSEMVLGQSLVSFLGRMQTLPPLKACEKTPAWRFLPHLRLCILWVINSAQILKIHISAHNVQDIRISNANTNTNVLSVECSLDKSRENSKVCVCFRR